MEFQDFQREHELLKERVNQVLLIVKKENKKVPVYTVPEILYDQVLSAPERTEKNISDKTLCWSLRRCTYIVSYLTHFKTNVLYKENITSFLLKFLHVGRAYLQENATLS